MHRVVRLCIPLIALTVASLSAVDRRELTTQASGGARASSAPVSAPPALSVDQVLSSPFPSELTAAPVGEAVAWVVNERGRRAVWMAEGPAFTGRRLAGFDEDDGQEITELTWTPDAQALLFVRGGGPNGRGEIPNPTSDPDGAEQTVWSIARAGGEPRRIGTGSQIAIAPRGDRVAWASRGQLWAAALTGEPKPAAIATVRGSAGGPRWSPDGTRLAFVSRRGMNAYVGVLDPVARTVVFLDPSVDTDGDPVWSPDGMHVAFIRRPVNPDRLQFMSEREGDPWSIRVADAKTGVGREVWRAQAGSGSVFRGVVGNDQLLWADGDLLVFPWEREGWIQLYAMSARGGVPTLLTPGQFEVEYVSPTPDRKGVIFNSNQDDIDRRHVWRVNASGGPPMPLTTGTGIEWDPAMLPDGRSIAYLRTDARRPGQAWMIRPGSEPRELAPLPASFPTNALVVPEAVTVNAADGLAVPAQLFKPAGIASGDRRPAVIFFHGGSRRQMLLGWHYSAYYYATYAFNQYLASRGFVVLSLNYRGGTGYGLEFREAINQGALGASEFNDVVGAGLYLRGRSDVDPNRIGLWGGSYGGYLTAMGLSRASDLFAAGVDIHGVHNWNNVIPTFMPLYDQLKQPDLAKRIFASSPMAFVDSWKSPVLLIHGDDDRNVIFSETVDLVVQLRRRNVHLEQLILPDEIHGFLRHESWVRVFGAAAEFLERQLIKKTGSPSAEARSRG